MLGLEAGYDSDVRGEYRYIYEEIKVRTFSIVYQVPEGTEQEIYPTFCCTTTLEADSSASTAKAVRMGHTFQHS